MPDLGNNDTNNKVDYLEAPNLSAENKTQIPLQRKDTFLGGSTQDKNPSHKTELATLKTQYAAQDANKINAIQNELQTLQVDKASNETLSLFARGELLARALDNCHLRRNGDIDFSDWDRRMTTISSDGYTSASSTLIMPEKPISVYKNIGFLIDSTKTEIGHISETDSGSNGNVKDGDFRANPTNIASLSQLNKYISEFNHYTMNEVNINFKQDAVVGLFAASPNVSKRIVPTNTLEVIEVQRYIREKYNTEMPIFIYSIDEGKLYPYKPSPEKITELLSNIPNEQVRARHKRALDSLPDAPYHSPHSTSIK